MGGLARPAWCTCTSCPRPRAAAELPPPAAELQTGGPREGTKTRAWIMRSSILPMVGSVCE